MQLQMPMLHLLQRLRLQMQLQQRPLVMHLRLQQLRQLLRLQRLHLKLQLRLQQLLQLLRYRI